MLSVYEKAMECIVKEQLSAFFEENDVIIEQQSGFRKSHSCETSLNFETIDRNLLLRKFERERV
jgi:hypothetical protein